MKDKESKEKEIREVARSERSRGARRSTVSRQNQQQLIRDLADLLQITEEREYIRALERRFGINETSPRFAEVLQIWREQHGGGQHRG
jgi:hypothetical protein